MTNRKNAARVAGEAAACSGVPQTAHGMLPSIKQVQFLAAMAILESLSSATTTLNQPWRPEYLNPSNAIDLAVEIVEGMMMQSAPDMDDWLLAWWRVGSVLTLALDALPAESGAASCYVRRAAQDVESFSSALMSLGELTYRCNSLASAPQVPEDKLSADFLDFMMAYGKQGPGGQDEAKARFSAYRALGRR